MTKENMRLRFKNTFSWERTICRVIAAWCLFAMTRLFMGINFYDISFAQNTPLWQMALICTAFFAGLSLLNLYLNEYETDSWGLILAATVCAVNWLLSYRTENENDASLVPLAVIAVYTLFFVYFVNRNEKLFFKTKLSKKTLIIIVSVLGGASCAVIAVTTCLRHLTFATPNFDFGLFVNMFHHMKETGLPFVTSERDVLLSHFAVHISPIYYVLLPFYYIFPSPLTLQIGQAVAVSSGISPTLLLARHLKLSRKTTAIVALLYACYPAFSMNCFYDIHENCFLLPLLLWVFYFFEKEKYPLMYLFAFLTLMVKEDAAVYIVIFALFVIFSKRKYLHGAILAIGSIAYFAGALWLLSRAGEYYAEFYADASPNPAINGPMINRFNNLIFDSEDGILGAVKTALLNPGYLLTQLFSENDHGWDKIVYFLQMLLSLGLIPFCTKKPSRWILLVPILMNTLTKYQYQYDIGFQYSFGVGAFLIYATILNLPDINLPTKKTLLTVAVSVCCGFYVLTVIPTMASRIQVYDRYEKQFSDMEEILDTVPKDASVCASAFLLSHMADRDVIYQTKYHGYDTDTDYVVLDIRYTEERNKVTIYEFYGYEIENELEGKIVILKKADKSS